MFVINAPSMLSFAWRVIQGFLDRVTTEKIHIMSSPAEWKPVLLKYIDAEQIPEMYGGSAKNPLPEEALLSMNPNPLLEKKKDLDVPAASDFPAEVEKNTIAVGSEGETSPPTLNDH